MRNVGLVVLSIWLVGFPTTAAQMMPPAGTTERIDQYVAQQMKARSIPGAVVAVLKFGKTIHRKAYGIANLESDTPMTTDSVFEIASVTKPFTAMAVMQLVEEGKIALEDPITKYVERVPA